MYRYRLSWQQRPLRVIVVLERALRGARRPIDTAGFLGFWLARR